MKKLIVLTGSGISAESGIPTFRGTEGSLWEGTDVREVATAGCLEKNRDNTYAFYNMLRNKYKNCFPNYAHRAIASLEKDYDVTVITQNVDNLHEQAGSSKVLHLHGELMKCRAVDDPNLIYDIPVDEKGEYNIYPDTIIDEHNVRPHIVFFGEDVPNLGKAISLMLEADICIVVGTSFIVYPAAGLISYVPMGNPIYYIDLDPKPLYDYPDIKVLEMTASKGMKELLKVLQPEND